MFNGCLQCQNNSHDKLVFGISCSRRVKMCIKVMTFCIIIYLCISNPVYLFTAEEHNIYNISDIQFIGIMYYSLPCLPQLAIHESCIQTFQIVWHTWRFQQGTIKMYCCKKWEAIEGQISTFWVYQMPPQQY